MKKSQIAKEYILQNLASGVCWADGAGHLCPLEQDPAVGVGEKDGGLSFRPLHDGLFLPCFGALFLPPLCLLCKGYEGDALPFCGGDAGFRMGRRHDGHGGRHGEGKSGGQPLSRL